MTSDRRDLSPEGRAATLRRHNVLAALRGPERDWKDVHDEDGGWLGRVPPVEVTDEDVAAAFERIAAVVSVAAEHSTVAGMLREGPTRRTTARRTARARSIAHRSARPAVAHFAPSTSVTRI